MDFKWNVYYRSRRVVLVVGNGQDDGPGRDHHEPHYETVTQAQHLDDSGTVEPL